MATLIFGTQYSIHAILISRIMSFPDLPPELVLQIATTLDDTHNILVLIRVSSDLYRWLKRPLYRHNIDYENSSRII